MLRILSISRLILEKSFSRILRLCSATKSRRDGTLLTVDFNLRLRNNECLSRSPAWDDTLLRLRSAFILSVVNTMQVSSHAGLVCVFAVSCFRRLKPAVNKMSSLRDLPFDMVRLRNMCFYFLSKIKSPGVALSSYFRKMTVAHAEMIGITRMVMMTQISQSEK